MTTTQKDERTQGLLSAAEAKFGFLPNVLRKMSESPAALEIYMHGQGALAHESNQLSPEHRNLVQLAASQKAECGYCTAVHTAMGRKGGVEPSVLEALGKGQSIPAEQGGLYVDATRLLMEKQGQLSAEDIAQLERDGIDRGTLYEIVANIAVKQVSNWVNHIAGTKLDAQFS